VLFSVCSPLLLFSLCLPPCFSDSNQVAQFFYFPLVLFLSVAWKIERKSGFFCHRHGSGTISCAFLFLTEGARMQRLRSQNARSIGLNTCHRRRVFENGEDPHRRLIKVALVGPDDGLLAKQAGRVAQERPWTGVSSGVGRKRPAGHSATNLSPFAASMLLLSAHVYVLILVFTSCFFFCLWPFYVSRQTTTSCFVQPARLAIDVGISFGTRPDTG